MQINPEIKKQLRTQHWIFLALLVIVVGSLAWLSVRYDLQFDWTQNKSNTPSAPTLALLNELNEEINLKAFISDANSTEKKNIQRVVNSFQRHSQLISLEYIDPIKHPEQAREHDIHNEGEVIIEAQQRQEKVTYIDEQSLANAIQRLLRNEQNWISFLEGHGERSPHNRGNFDYSTLHQQLEAKGFNVRSFTFADSAGVPENTSTLVIADPTNTLLPGEIQLIQEYVDAGNNLLWLSEPSSTARPEELSEQLGIEFQAGLIVDPNTQLLGINDPRFVMVPEYPPHPITRNFQTLSLFPTASAIEYIETEDWEFNILLESLPRSWVETEEIGTEEIDMDSGIDIPGPVSLGITLTRYPQTGLTSEETVNDSELDIDEAEVQVSEKQQRVVIIGDADFIADAYIGQAGNLDLALNIFNWLSRDDAFMNIPARTLVDQQINLSNPQQLFIAIVFLAIIPAGLIIAGLLIWQRRRRG